MSVRCKLDRYIIDYYPNGALGRRVIMTLPRGTTSDQAHKIEQDLRSFKTQRLVIHNDRISILARRYFEYISMHLAINTCKDIRSCFINHLLPYFGNMHNADIVTPLISAYQKLRISKPNIRNREDKAINSTINKELSYFSAFLKWIEDETGLTRPHQIHFRPLPYKRPLPNILSISEVDAIIQHADDHYKGLFIAIARLGLRITSARNLKWSNIDWKTSSISIRVKGNREIRLPIPDDLKRWLKRKSAQNSQNSPWLFPSSTIPMQPIADSRKALQRAVVKAGIAKRVHPHLFRHTAGAHLLESGIDLRVIQEILGHSDIRTTEWYTQVAMKTKIEAFVKIGYIKSSKRRSKK